jgi:hypothetical protein
MAEHATSRIVIAHEAHERFAILIRHQERTGRKAASSDSNFKIRGGPRKFDFHGHLQPWEQTVGPRNLDD